MDIEAAIVEAMEEPTEVAAVVELPPKAAQHLEELAEHMAEMAEMAAHIMPHQKQETMEQILPIWH